MLNVFTAGPELVSWDLTALGPNGPYRLAMHHTGGSIVEYFKNVRTAMLREGELEGLLMAARTFTVPVPDTGLTALPGPDASNEAPPQTVE